MLTTVMLSRFGPALGPFLSLLLVACSGDHIGADSVGQPEAFPEIEAAPAMLPRLTQLQYRNAIQDVFGDEISLPSRLEPDVSIDGLVSIGAAQTSISARGAEQYETAAYGIASQATEEGAIRDAIVTCVPASDIDDACAREVLSALGRRLWRRPLTEGELDTLVTISGNAAATLEDFYEGLSFGIATILQSPNFLFRTELGEEDPGNPNSLRYTDYEMAQRLSIFLWNTIPDEELLAAAEAGDLLDDEKLAAQVDRMIDHPKARGAIRNFFSESYGLYKLDELTKDTNEFVAMDAEVGPSAREETLRTIEDHIFDEKADFRDLFTTRKTFINRQLATIYNVPAPAREGFGAYYWPNDSPRTGLLTQVSVLAGNSHPVDSSATLRGKFVRKNLMCGVIIPPPVDVNAALPEPSPDAKTLRQRLESHVEDPSCAGCHLSMDPIGFGLENFDALGQFRAKESGEPIDASGDLDGVPFDNPRGLGEALAENPQVPDCVVQQLYRYATSHPETDEELVMVANLQQRFEAQDFQVLALMRDIALSPGFRTTNAPLETAGEEQ